MNFTIKEENGALKGILDGRLDTAAAADFVKDVKPLLDQADKEIVLDCEKLEYISSSGLRVFLALRKEAANKGGKVIIENINAEIRNVFTMTGFLNLFEIR